jgi:hypothetical protein
MSTPPELRDLAARLIAYESDVGKSSAPAESSALRVYEKLRQSLSSIAGAAAFESLAFRALLQAKSETQHLWSVQVAADGTLEGFGEFEPLIDNHMDLAVEEGITLIARLLSLLYIFLGEALTLSLLRDAWPGATLTIAVRGTGENREDR